MGGETKYASWSLIKLKEELKRRKKKVSGKKQDLIERLIFYDHHDVPTETPATRYQMTLPDATKFKDIHSGMCNLLKLITRERHEGFLSQFDKSVDRKVIDMYTEGYVRYVRVFKEGDEIFVSGCIWAEMTKRCSYKVDIKFDIFGVAVESQCECGAGTGPTAHCKHVSVCIFALTEFGKNGKITTDLTCTQQLQTFHHAPANTGTPMKASNLHIIRERKQPLFDPRPTKYRKLQSAQDTFRSKCINYQASRTERPMPVMQLFPPANIPALYLDHDYLPNTMEDEFIRQLNLVSISDELIKDIQHTTEGQSGNAMWFEYRQFRLTASKFGSICKATEKCNKVQMASRQMDTSKISNKYVNHGIQYEPVAIAKFEEKTGKTVQQCGLFVSKENPFIAASPDGIIDENTVIEVKCPYTARLEKNIDNADLPFLTPDGKLKENSDYYYQVQGQLYCSNRNSCYFVIFTFKDIKIIHVPRNNVFIKTMVEKLKTFFQEFYRPLIIERFLYKSYNSYSFDSLY